MKRAFSGLCYALSLHAYEFSFNAVLLMILMGAQGGVITVLSPGFKERRKSLIWAVK